MSTALLPPPLASLFPASSLRAAERFLVGGTVTDIAFWRMSLSGRAVGANRRVLPVWIALDGLGAFQRASCPCSASQKPGSLCYHLAALALVACRGGEGPSLPVQRFKRSLWYHLAEALPQSVHIVAHGEVRVAESRDGVLLARLEGDPVASEWVAVASAFPASGTPQLTNAEQNLARFSKTPDEDRFNRSGIKTRGQAFEESFPHFLAKRAFEAWGEGPVSLALRVTAGRLYVTAAHGATRLEVLVAPEALPGLMKELPGFFVSHGFTEVPEPAEPSLTLRFDPDGTLVLAPAILLRQDGEERVVAQQGEGVFRAGGVLLLYESKLIARLAPGRKPFAEPEAGLQAELVFDGLYRPSPVGLPLDQETRVPPDQFARFLSRHQAELAAWPRSLLPVELRDGGLAEPEAAEVFLQGLAGESFQLSVTYLVNGHRLSAARILRARRQRDRILFVGGAVIVPGHPRFSWLDLLPDVPEAGDEDELTLTLSSLEACRLRTFLPEDQRVLAGPGAGEALARFLAVSPESSAPPPEELGFGLFDFQRTGYGWLWFLARNGFGGLLCDDMGLGKTFQTMALIGAVHKGAPELSRTVIVCPASVLPHWEEKLRQYLPEVTICTHAGGSRTLEDAARSAIVLTTYGTLRNDIVDFESLSVDLLVLDEMHVVKNRGTLTHQAMKKLPARVVVGLTGTPIENSVEELRNLLELVLPGYLPPEAAFRKNFVKPIEEGDPGAEERLRRLIRPFVLRRTKEQVLSSLPEKIEDRRVCSLSAEQARLYEDTLDRRGQDLRQGLAGGKSISYLHVFALLSKLKQICDHPALVLPREGALLPCGKWDLFTELLDEALESGLKVVVFSQYVRMLDLIGRYLDERAISFAEIRGATVDRATPVRRFRQEPSCRVFLASLNAAGAGIDLTPASVVIHYDRWWNQAREDQATARVHRFGQKRGVQVLSLVTKGTVEERIERMIARKARLSREIVPEDEAGFLKRFSRDELAELLSPHRD